MRQHAIASVVFLSMTACGTASLGGATSVHNASVDPGFAQYNRGLRGQGPVVIYGSPPDGATPAAVAGALRLPARLGGAPMTLVEPGSAQPRLAIAFGAASPDELCGGTAAPASPPTLYISGAACVGTRVFGQGILESGSVRGPSDPDFGRVVNELASVILVPVRASRVR